jgi:hypothetical protein
MTLDKIIEKAKTYRIADMSGEHNIGEVMEELYDRVLFLEGQATHDLGAETERLRWELRSYTQLGGDSDRYSAIWREENPFNDK